MKHKSHKANEELRAKLRALIDSDGVSRVSRDLGIGTEALARYLADLPIHKTTFRGIEASIAALPPEPGGH